jgi:hypothetical protein
MAKVALIDNVLLQKAVSTAPGYHMQIGTSIRLPIVTALPQDYAGVVSDDGETLSVSSSFR